MLRNLATSADNTHNPTSAPPQYDDDFEDDEEQNETQNETQNEEEEYYDDDFEEDEATPVAGRAVEGETEIMRAIREENERALRASDDRYRYGDENDRPIGGFDDRAFDFDSHARDRVPERKVKSFPGKGARHATTLTDAQIRAARERVRRWDMVVRARHVRMTAADASCGTDAIVDRAPKTHQQLFLAGLGPFAASRFATCQTRGEDSTRDADAQTESTDDGRSHSCATQCPEDLVASRDDLELASMGGSSARVARRAAANRAARWARASGDLQHSKNKRLGGFIQRVGAVVDVLLRERPPPRGHVPDVMRIGGADGRLKPHARASQAGSLTESYAAFHHPALTASRRVVDAAFAPGPRGARTLAIAYAPSDPHARGAAGRGLVLVWDVGAAGCVASRALTCESVPTRVVWGPGDSHHLVVAGTEEGGVCVWDMREPAEAHAESAESGDVPTGALADGECLRRPSYGTEGFAGAVDNVGADSDDWEDTPGSIVALGVALDGASTSAHSVPAPVTPGREPGGEGDDHDGRPRRDPAAASGASFAGSTSDFYVVALDCWGKVSSFKVSELSRREALDASIADVGLRFGSRVRAARNARSIPYGAAGDTPTGSRGFGGARAMAVTNRAGVAAEFYVAGEDGRVLRGARYGAPSTPKAFVPCDPLDAGHAAASAPNEAVVSLDFNPHFPNVFLAAYEGGSVAMYSTASSLASRRWDGVTAAKVVTARWSPARPSAFFVLDDECCVHAYDLLSDDASRSVKSERFGKREKITSLKLAKLGDQAWDAPGQCLASMAYDDGRTDVHVVSRELSSITAREMDQLRSLIV